MAESVIKGKRQDFTLVFNSVVKDKRLSLKTLGLFTIMQSFPDDWEYSVSGLAARAGVGRDTIRNCLRELQAAGYLLREQGHVGGGRFGPMTYVLQAQAPPQTEKPSAAEPSTVKPMTENRPQVNKHLSKETLKKPPIPPTGDERDKDLFESFWAAYPKKKAKASARKSWDKLNPDMDLCKAMSTALEAQKHSTDWQRDDGRFIPYPATWLNQRRWEDEIEAPRPAMAGIPQISEDDERRGRYL